MSIALIAIIGYALNPLKIHFHPYFPGLIVFFWGQSLIVAWLFSMGEKDRQQMPVFFLSGIVLRFVTAIVLLVFFALLEPPGIKALIIQFSVLYLVFMIFELIMALANLRRN